MAVVLAAFFLAHPGLASQHLVPLVAGWERFFTLSWSVSEVRGQPVVDGYISNDFGFSAMKVRLLAEGLDEAGRVVSQQVSWLGTELAAGTRQYFEIPIRQRASSYRVSVFAYDWLQSASLLQAP